MAGLTLIRQPGDLAVCRLDAGVGLPAWALTSPLCFIARTPDETSVVCAADHVPPGIIHEAGWRAFKVQGPLDFGMVGVLASLAGTLAEAGISIFAVSTYDTDYILVKSDSFASAAEALRAASHTVL